MEVHPSRMEKQRGCFEKNDYIRGNNDHLIMSSVLKYIVRAVKYFFYFTILLIIIMTVLVLAPVV